MTALAQPEKTFLFHICLPKTGTTSIQGALINLLPEIEQLGFCHPYDRTVYGTTYPNPGVPSMPAQNDAPETHNVTKLVAELPPLDRLALSRRETDAIMARWRQDRVTLRDSYGLEIRDPDFTPGPEVLQFSSDFAAEIRDQVAAKFSDSDMAALDLALGLADTDIEEIVAAEPKPGIRTDRFRPRQ